MTWLDVGLMVGLMVSTVVAVLVAESLARLGLRWVSGFLAARRRRRRERDALRERIRRHTAEAREEWWNRRLEPRLTEPGEAEPEIIREAREIAARRWGGGRL